MRETDQSVEKLRSLRTGQLAYMRDVTLTMRHDIQALRDGAKVIGRAFTVKGPDIYLNALESIPAGAIYVHGHASEDHAVWSGAYAELYGKPRGLVGVVIDGGIHNRKATMDSEIPTFARFVSPLPAINRREGEIQVAVVCGGVTVCPGDTVVGDSDGVVVVPRRNEEEILRKVDGFLSGMALFGKIARQPGVVITEHEALREMFRLKYEHPNDYWRYYEEWAAKWDKRFGG
jgi:4-hydroxy-4-methyl-2-oxoglutarate aldolase